MFEVICLMTITRFYFTILPCQKFKKKSQTLWFLYLYKILYIYSISLIRILSEIWKAHLPFHFHLDPGSTLEDNCLSFDIPDPTTSLSWYLNKGEEKWDSTSSFPINFLLFSPLSCSFANLIFFPRKINGKKKWFNQLKSSNISFIWKE